MQLLTDGRIRCIVERYGSRQLAEWYGMVPLRLQLGSRDRRKHTLAALRAIRSRAECQGRYLFIFIMKSYNNQNQQNSN